MTERPVECPEGNDTRLQQQADLLEQALQQPGVREFIEVYDSYRPLEDAARSYRQVMEIKSVVSTTDSSGPVTRWTP